MSELDWCHYCGKQVPQNHPFNGACQLKTEVEPVTSAIEMRCKDDPEALGRVAKLGEQRFTLIFPLENGDTLKLHMGREGMNHFETFIAQMMVDDSTASATHTAIGDLDNLGKMGG